MRAFAIVAVWFVVCGNAQDLFNVYSIGVTLMQPMGCPVYITDVVPGSPAARAGLKAGDRIKAVDGTRIQSNADAARLVRAYAPDKVRVRVTRDRNEYEAVIPREKIDKIFAAAGSKIVSGVLVPLSFSGTWISGRVFPNGYPLESALFYPGFEALIVPDAGRSTIHGLVIRGSLQLVVGDVEPGGPAAHAGVQSGDTILAVNGVAPGGKSTEELYRLLSSHEPATMQLTIRHAADPPRTVEFPLAQAAEVAHESGKRIVNALPVPAWLLDGKTGCHPK